jgi:hypothetical protein
VSGSNIGIWKDSELVHVPNYERKDRNEVSSLVIFDSFPKWFKKGGIHGIYKRLYKWWKGGTRDSLAGVWTEVLSCYKWILQLNNVSISSSEYGS